MCIQLYFNNIKSFDRFLIDPVPITDGFGRWSKHKTGLGTYFR